MGYVRDENERYIESTGEEDFDDGNYEVKKRHKDRKYYGDTDFH